MQQTPIACTKAFAEPPPYTVKKACSSVQGLTQTHAQTNHRSKHTYCHIHYHKQKPGGPLYTSKDTSRLTSQNQPQLVLTSQNQPLADTCMQWTMDLLGTGHKISHAQLPGSQALPALTQRDTLVHRHTSQGHRPRTHCTLYTEATTEPQAPTSLSL